MPSGWTNDCEDVIQLSDDTVELKTKSEVLHAETNALAKIAKSTNSSEGSSLFVTHAPCLDCAKLIYQSGINSVYYRNSYRDEKGIDFLKHCKVEVSKV
jgi:dCMP deaminase